MTFQDWVEVVLQYRPVVLSRTAPYEECGVPSLGGSCFTVLTNAFLFWHERNETVVHVRHGGGRVQALLPLPPERHVLPHRAVRHSARRNALRPRILQQRTFLAPFPLLRFVACGFLFAEFS